MKLTISIPDIFLALGNIDEHAHDDQSVVAISKNSDAIVCAVRQIVESRIAASNEITDIDLALISEESGIGCTLFADDVVESLVEEVLDQGQNENYQLSKSISFKALPPNFDRELHVKSKAGRKRMSSTARNKADSEGKAVVEIGDVNILTSSDDDEHAPPTYSWSVEPRHKNPLLALVTRGVAMVLAELLLRLETIRLPGWPLCQQSVAFIIRPQTFPNLKRLSLAGCTICNLFTTLAIPNGAGHATLVELNLTGVMSATEPGTDTVDPNIPVIVSALPALQRLYISNSWVQLNDSLLVALASNCRDLRAVVFSPQAEGPTEYGFGFTDNGVLALFRGCNRLEVINLGYRLNDKICSQLAELVPNLTVFVEAFINREDESCEGDDGYNAKSISKRRKGSEHNSSDKMQGFVGTLPVDPSQLRYLDIRTGALLKPKLFAKFAAATICVSPLLQHLFLGRPTKSLHDSFCMEVASAITKAYSFAALEILCIPYHPSIDTAVLKRLASGEFPKLSSWTHSADCPPATADVMKICPWTVECISAIPPTHSLVQLSLCGFSLNGEFLVALSNAFPMLKWLNFESYALPLLSDAITASSVLCCVLTEFPNLHNLLLPPTRKRTGSTKQDFDWFSFALFRSTQDTLDTARVVYPLPSVLLANDCAGGGIASSALLRLVDAFNITAFDASDPNEIHIARRDAAFAQSKLPDRIEVSSLGDTCFSTPHDRLYI